MTRYSFFFFLILLNIGCALSAQADALLQRLGDRLSVTGSKIYTLQSLSVSGNEDMFVDDNYGYSSRYMNETNLTVMGNIWPGLSITATMSNNKWSPNERSFTLNYNRGRTRASLGDISASLTGNELIPFSKTLRGATITQNFGFGSVTAIASRTKAATRTITISGNNTPGPYYLGVTQIVDGSEQVKIDDREISRTSNTGITNYTLDSMSGILTFSDSYIVASTSTISISFESQSYNTTSGNIYGLRSDIPFGKDASVGFTYLAQSANDSGNKQYQRISEYFYGNGSTGMPYELMYIPLENSVTVEIDGILQLPTNYSINYSRHYILLPRTIEAGSTIIVSYTPKPQDAVTGDRKVMGMDAKFKVSEALTLTGQLARSSSDSIGTDDYGSATSLRASGKYGKVEYTAGLRNIDAGYSPVESAGFFRNERGGDFDLKYKLSDQLSWFTKIERFHRPDIQSTTDSENNLNLLSTQTSNGFEWRPAQSSALKFTRTRMDNSGLNNYKNSYATDSLSMNWGIGKFSASGELSRSDRDYTYLSSVDQSLITTNDQVDTSRISLRFLPSQKYSLSADVSKSNITNSNGSSTDAKNYQLTAVFSPMSTVNVSTSYRISDSGRVTSSIYPGSEGYINDSYINSYDSKSATRNINISWSPSKYFSFNTSFDKTSAEGDNSTNTSVNGTDVGFTYTPSEIVKVYAHSSKQNGNYIGSSGSMSSRIGFLTLNIGPIQKYSLDLNYQKVLSGTVTSITQNSITKDDICDVNLESFSSTLRRDIGGGRYLFTEYQSSSTGVDSTYSDSTAGVSSNRKTIYAIGIEYPLNAILGLKIDWRIIDYNNPNSETSDYHANMLYAQIGARFK